ncbi:hypothetical protein AAGS40_00945 [Paraburkholderia sp. PREW-6R]|uniref:hypothetical protein n=1 Tax=Paraburkholderia sp. PREW-6R TaxID=3141544 RepID=UPI0031F4C511
MLRLALGNYFKVGDEMARLDGLRVYLFKCQAHLPANAEQCFDCKEAGTNVEHLICQDSELVKPDKTVNRGYVAMLLTD